VANKQKLSGRSYFEKSSKNWYELWCPRQISLIEKKKIVVPELSDRNRFGLAEPSVYYGDTVCGIVLKPETRENILYILGLLNSIAVEFFFKNTTVPKAGGYYIYKTMFLKNIPIRIINFNDPADVARHDQMVNLVEQMLELNKKLAESKMPQATEILKRQIDATDRQIDDLVYKLYDLTDEEIKIVESET